MLRGPWQEEIVGGVGCYLLDKAGFEEKDHTPGRKALMIEKDIKE